MISGVRRFLDAPPSHITWRDMDVLRSWAAYEGDAPFFTLRFDDAFWILVPIEDPEAVSEKIQKGVSDWSISQSFNALVEYAQINGCSWIMINDDASPIEGLALAESERSKKKAAEKLAEDYRSYLNPYKIRPATTTSDFGVALRQVINVRVTTTQVAPTRSDPEPETDF